MTPCLALQVLDLRTKVCAYIAGLLNHLPDKGLLSLPPLPGNTWKHPLINILT